MKRLILSVLVCFAVLNTAVVEAQELKFGLKGGINKAFGGEITGIPSTPDYTDETFYGEGEIGYHGGIWAQVNFGKFFVRPEVMYSALKSRFDFPQGSSIYAVDALSVPLLLGYNVYGPIDIYAGPAYNKIMDSSIERLEPLDNPPNVVVQNSPINAQIGVKAEFGSFGVDVRYEHSLATREPQLNMDFVSDNSDFTIPVLNRATIDDARLSQIIVSLTVKLFDSANAGNRRRGGNCYF